MIEWPNLTRTQNWFSPIFENKPECYGGKLVDNGGVNVLVVLCVIGDEVAKSPLAENHGEILLVGDLLEFSSNKLSRKLGEILVLISDLRMIVKNRRAPNLKDEFFP